MPSLNPDAQRRFALEVVQTLRAKGFQAYWAGGCVRDYLLGLVPKDYDVATSARPEEIRAAFPRRRTLAVGAAFGVIAVVGPRGAGTIEVATFRQDLGYSDGRRPDGVVFTSAQHDAERRDFTINGLFFDPVDERVFDFVGGQDDLSQGLVRAIGDPEARFREDKLRMLRAVRFAARFGFAIEQRTQDAIRRMAGELTVVSVERIAAELRLILTHASRAAGIEMLRESGLLATALPELAPLVEGAPRAGSWQLALGALQRLHEPSFPLALAALVEGTLAGEAAWQLCRRLRLSNDESKRVRWLVDQRRALVGARNQPWPRLQRLLIAAGADELVALHLARAGASGQDADDFEFCRLLRTLPTDTLDPSPLVTGDDLSAAGIEAGPAYQRLLVALRDAQLSEQIHSRDAALALACRLAATGGWRAVERGGEP